MISSPKVEWIHVEPPRNLVDVRLHGKEALRGAIAPHSPGNSKVRIHGIGLEVVGFCTVEAQCLMARTACNCEAMCGIRSCIANKLHRDGEQGTVCFYGN